MKELQPTRAKKNQYDIEGNAKHYNETDVETIDKIERVWGTYLTSKHCWITAFKYRDRLGHKPEDMNLELTKIKWYEDKAKELENRIGTEEEFLNVKSSASMSLEYTWLTPKNISIC